MEIQMSIYSLFTTLKAVFDLMQSRQNLKEKFDIVDIIKFSKHTDQMTLKLELELLTDLKLLNYESRAECYDTQNIKHDSWSITGQGCLIVLNNFRTLTIPEVRG